jgi:intron-binding protein aquarius
MQTNFTRFLWPTYTEDSSNYHVLLIARIVGIKQREHLSIWGSFKYTLSIHYQIADFAVPDLFGDRPDEFSNLFHRVLSMSLDPSLSTSSRLSLLSFIICGFQSLENGLIRKECAPLVSISIWHNLSSEEARERSLDKAPMLRKAWRAAAKRYESADERTKAKIRFERSWLYAMLLDFMQRLNGVGKDQEEDSHYCERFLELLVDLDSQLPTRRYVNTLLKDLNILPVIRLSKLYDVAENALIRDFYSLLRHFITFAIDDYSGGPLSPQSVYDIHCQELAQLQRTAIKHFKEKLTLLALSNYGSIEQRAELEGHLASLEDAELRDLCSRLGFRTGSSILKFYCLSLNESLHSKKELRS